MNESGGGIGRWRLKRRNGVKQNDGIMTEGLGDGGNWTPEIQVPGQVKQEERNGKRGDETAGAALCGCPLACVGV